MHFTLDEIGTWLIVGALAGSLAGVLVKRRKEGFGGLTNLGIGLVGALLGGALFSPHRLKNLLGIVEQEAFKAAHFRAVSLLGVPASK